LSNNSKNNAAGLTLPYKLWRVSGAAGLQDQPNAALCLQRLESASRGDEAALGRTTEEDKEVGPGIADQLS